jgi:NAD(P)-dependent dehydrogenase (short-subunit alcohol dehydrogenase family)
MFDYDTTKGGIEATTRAMALDLVRLNIRVNTEVAQRGKPQPGSYPPLRH